MKDYPSKATSTSPISPSSEHIEIARQIAYNICDNDQEARREMINEIMNIVRSQMEADIENAVKHLEYLKTNQPNF